MLRFTLHSNHLDLSLSYFAHLHSFSSIQGNCFPISFQLVIVPWVWHHPFAFPEQLHILWDRSHSFIKLGASCWFPLHYDHLVFNSAFLRLEEHLLHEFTFVCSKEAPSKGFLQSVQKSKSKLPSFSSCSLPAVWHNIMCLEIILHFYYSLPWTIMQVLSIT